MTKIPVSLSARRAWIEISLEQRNIHHFLVALRKESVDRNAIQGVDVYQVAAVALRKESVDRNAIQGVDVYQVAASLSARRAWIEILYSRRACAIL